jgi:ABC-2 type transport system ATP-binding protein
MPDFFGVYDEMKVWEYLDFFAAAYRISRDRRPAIINDVLELTDLTGKKDEFVEGLSRGMKQRLCLARCLVHDPKVLLLDEPASGLDPRARVEFRELIKELRRMGKTILVSSHILTELADFCTHIGIIEQGMMVVTGSVGEIRAKLRPHRVLKIKVIGDPEPARTLLMSLGEKVKEVELDAETGNMLRVHFTGGDDFLLEIQKKLNEAGIGVTSFSEEEEDLEGIFMKVTKGIVS